MKTLDCDEALYRMFTATVSSHIRVYQVTKMFKFPPQAPKKHSTHNKVIYVIAVAYKIVRPIFRWIKLIIIWSAYQKTFC